MTHKTIVNDPEGFAKVWYSSGECHAAINNPVIESDRPPQDVRSEEFSNWLSVQYQLAMVKGARLAMASLNQRIASLEVQLEQAEDAETFCGHCACSSCEAERAKRDKEWGA